MNRRYLYAALGLLLLVNAVVLVGVARNRSGVPDASLTLSERELPLSWDFRDRENTGVSLQLNVNFDNEEQQWFNESKLAELGFDTRHDREEELGYTKRVLPKKAFVVLEYEGEAWQRYRQRQLDEIAAIPLKVAQGKLESEDAERQIKEKRFQLSVVSRLFSVDAGLDPGVFRDKYPDRARYIIVPAQVRMHIDRRPKSSGQGGGIVSGRVQRILVNQVHVPRIFHRQLQTLPQKARIQPGYTYYNPEDPAQIRYHVQIAFGQRLEPWITEIKVLDAQDLHDAGLKGL
ncbi:MAG: DUF4824 family protein [Pedobacter sp.]